MNLEGLLNASLELEKRIQTDRMLRGYLSNLWEKTGQRRSANQPPPKVRETPSGNRQVTFELPPEMCELLELAADATGKSQVELLEESFAEYYLKHFEKSQS